MRKRLTAWLFSMLMVHVAGRRPPNFVVGADDPAGAYLRRWYITPWRGWFQAIPEPQRNRWQRSVVWATQHLLPNLYLHQFLRDDDDRALHDHPSWAVSLILRGAYLEHTRGAYGRPMRHLHKAGSLRFMPTLHAHRIELLREVVVPSDRNGAGRPPAVHPRPCWTLFLFGPKRRDWGFWCGDRWVPWQQFTAAGKPGEVGRGCD